MISPINEVSGVSLPPSNPSHGTSLARSGSGLICDSYLRVTSLNFTLTLPSSFFFVTLSVHPRHSPFVWGFFSLALLQKQLQQERGDLTPQTRSGFYLNIYDLISSPFPLPTLSIPHTHRILHCPFLTR
ncbi:hypothetical protein POX_g09085 [Penicillium oxalicum]|uniref:Uncharacterized protein n=1 Tax=Penicillium oxalicum (strain 114-2 / CGMCC 5302) TaxID=933388 RepID=S8AL72_PENO1|nr:hypothetical protein POX_g09085 [Penicillium oxalicum]EPS26613.1 hypothetical protein PDE_01551 [Penicillium oxalicum 114-2]KAI2786697.1 hypothetical protein POX_g09085 [Penicillium oxalicum]